MDIQDKKHINKYLLHYGSRLRFIIYPHKNKLCLFAHCSIKITRQVYFSFMNSFRQNTNCSQTKWVFNLVRSTFIIISKKSNAAIHKNNDMQKYNNCVQCYANCLQINYAAESVSARGSVTTWTVSHQIGLECAGNYLDKFL